MTQNTQGHALVRAIGLMSGTSLDGVDVAFLRTDGEAVVARGASRTYPYEAAFQARLERSLEIGRTLAGRGERPDELRSIEEALTDRHAEVVRRFMDENALGTGDVDIVGFHGQTVLHRPHDALTVQIGDGERLAGALGLPVAWDLRAGDMEAGGQGAPLVPAYHRALAASLPERFRRGPVCFVNVGGISNITYLDGDADPIAFDCGPGNALIDQWLRREAGIPFDEDGRIASEGRVIGRMVERYLGVPFFEKPFPKSLDRFDFEVPGAADGDLSDVARTLCRVTALAIAKAREHMPEAPSLWIVAGGGRRHPAILSDLKDALAGEAEVALAEEYGFDGDAMEAEAWAYLAVRSTKGLALTFPTTTGCRAPTTGGMISRPQKRAKQEQLPATNPSGRDRSRRPQSSNV